MPNCFCDENLSSYSFSVPFWQTTANNLRWAGFQNADEVSNFDKTDSSLALTLPCCHNATPQVKRWCDGKIKAVDLVLLNNDSICQQSACSASECVAASRRAPKRRSASVRALVAQIARTWALPSIISLSSYLGNSPKPPPVPLALGLRAAEDHRAGQDESPPAGAGLMCTFPPCEDPIRPGSLHPPPFSEVEEGAFSPPATRRRHILQAAAPSSAPSIVAACCSTKAGSVANREEDRNPSPPAPVRATPVQENLLPTSTPPLIPSDGGSCHVPAILLVASPSLAERSGSPPPPLSADEEEGIEAGAAEPTSRDRATAPPRLAAAAAVVGPAAAAEGGDLSSADPATVPGPPAAAAQRGATLLDDDYWLQLAGVSPPASPQPQPQPAAASRGASPRKDDDYWAELVSRISDGGGGGGGSGPTCSETYWGFGALLSPPAPSPSDVSTMSISPNSCNGGGSSSVGGGGSSSSGGGGGGSSSAGRGSGERSAADARRRLFGDGWVAGTTMYLV